MSIVIATVYSSQKVQLIKMPAEARFPNEVKKVFIRIRGRERIITPVENSWDNFFLNSPVVSDDFLNERQE